MGGQVLANADARLGGTSGALTFNGGALQFGATFNLSSTRAMTLSAGGGTLDTNGFNTAISQVITGVGALTKTGTGTLTLSGSSNAWLWGTNLNGGTLSINAPSRLGTGSLSFDTGTLEITNNPAIPFAHLITLQSGGGTVSGTGYLDGVISGVGAFTKTGLGGIYLRGTNTYQGGTNINNGGNIFISTDQNLGDAAGGITFDNATLIIEGNVTSNRPVTLKQGAAVLVL